MNKKPLRILLAHAWNSHELAAGVAQYAVEAGWHLDTTFFFSVEQPGDWNGDGILAGGYPAVIRNARRPPDTANSSWKKRNDN